MNKDHLGRWKIESMELWSQDDIGRNQPGYVLLNADGTGELVFGDVVASIDGEFDEETGRFEYSWESRGDRDPANGRGWFKFLSAESAAGQLHIHMGDALQITLTRT
jgi:hypothetical protein